MVGKCQGPSNLHQAADNVVHGQVGKQRHGNAVIEVRTEAVQFKPAAHGEMNRFILQSGLGQFQPACFDKGRVSEHIGEAYFRPLKRTEPKPDDDYTDAGIHGQSTPLRHTPPDKHGSHLLDNKHHRIDEYPGLY